MYQLFKNFHEKVRNGKTFKKFHTQFRKKVSQLKTRLRVKGEWLKEVIASKRRVPVQKRKPTSLSQKKIDPLPLREVPLKYELLPILER